MRWGPVALLALLVAGCSVDPLALEGRECPCIDGWVCDSATNTCIEADGPPMDSGVGDTPPVDTGVPTDTAVGDTDGLDSMAPDTTVVDAGPDPTGCDDVHAGRLFCDGFEAVGFDAWGGEQAPGGSTLERVTDTVYRGTGALRAEAVDGENYAQLYAEVFPIPAPTDQWFRGYYYFPAGGPPGIEFHELTDTDRTYNFIVYTRNGTENDFHSHGFGDARGYFDMLMPQGRWFCLEVHLDLGAGAISAYVDDVLTASQSGLDLTTPRGLSTIHAGVAWNDTGAAAVLYVDEVVADTERIGCD